MTKSWLFELIACLALSACVAAPAASATPQPALAPTSTPIPKPALTPDARPAIDTPAWFNNATLYQVFLRSFRDSDGDGIGDLNGLRSQLDYIQSLGVDTIWLNPHYPSTTYHGYDVADYTAVNPQFGALDDFKALLAEMKQRDMKLIVDFVANHSSNAHPFFKDAYKNPASQYTDWYEFTDDANTNYRSFAGVAELPEWNLGNPKVADYLIESAMFWLDLGVDGLRADYAKGVERPIWQQLREAVKAKHPDAVLLGEVWDGSPAILKRYYDAGFDALFDFPSYTILSENHDANGDGVLNGKGMLDLLKATLLSQQVIYPRGAQVVRFLSNHDTNRIASDVLEDPTRMKLAAEFAVLAPGIPIIYYGEEIGMRGVKGGGPVYDEYRREPMDWYAGETGAGMTTWFKPADRNNKPDDGVSVEEENESPDSLLNTYRALTKLRADHPALHSGQFQVMERVEGCPSCLSLWRWADDEVIALFFNFGDAEHDLAFNAAEQSPVPLSGQAEFIYGEADSLTDLVIRPWSTIALRWQNQ